MAAPAPSPTNAPKSSSIRRSRPSYRCESCRGRRVKCDQTRPKCSNCARNEVECVYGETNLKRKDPPGDAATNESPAKVVRRNGEGKETQSNHGYLLLQNGGRSRYIENTFWASVDVEGLELDTLLFDLPLFPLEGICCAAGKDVDNHASSTPCHHYIGTTEPNFSFWASRRPTALRADAHSLASTLSKLPPRETCDYVYEHFVESVHPLIPLLHLPTFDRQYRRFWDWHKTWTVGDAPDGVLAEYPSFLPLLLTVLFTGSIARSTPDAVSMYLPIETQKMLYYMIPAALSMVGFPHSPSLYSLIAFLLLNSMLIREEESLSSCSFVAVAFRVCQAMGLHKDGTDFGLDEVQVEERRRVWCHLMHLDVMTSIVSGLPLVASSEMFSNTQMIRELRDEYIGKVDLTDDIDNDSIIDPNYILTAGRYDSTSCIRSILLQQFSPRPVSLVCVNNIEKRIKELQVRTKERIKRLSLQSYKEQSSPSSLLNLSPSVSSNNVSEASNPRVRWGKDLLSLMVEKAYCLLYQPTMRDSNLWMELRARAIPRFQSFLSIFIDMCTAESYLNYQWLYPGAYQPLQPVAVLLTDLWKNPQSLEASKSRALLEKTFSLLGPEGRITNGASRASCWPDQRYTSVGAKQAWMRLEKLRSKVWQKLGLDHRVLWMKSIRQTGQQSESVVTAARSASTSQVTTQQPQSSEQSEGPDANLSLSAEPQK
ncbi:fungal-specific transcription factor domain-containing protein [Halenospora varia]|nr:fungal-specific transcription factor domain-containing protein [Halenospora varia]